MVNTIDEYRDEHGKSPFGGWFGGLKDKEARRRIRRGVANLRRGATGGVKPIGGGLSELRIHYGPGYRVYFGTERGHVYLLLCGGDKSTQSADINKARAYWRDHKRRN